MATALATRPPTLEKRVSGLGAASAAPDARSGRTFSTEEYLSILRQAQSLQREQALKAQEARAKAVYDQLPAEEKDAHRVSMESIYASAADIGIAHGSIDAAVAHYFPPDGEVAAAMNSLGGMKMTTKRRRLSDIERLNAYQSIFVEELSSRLPDCAVVAHDRNSLLYRFIRALPYPFSIDSSDECHADVEVHSRSRRCALRVTMKTAVLSSDAFVVSVYVPDIAPAAIVGANAALARARLYRAELLGIPKEYTMTIERCISSKLICDFDPKMSS